MSVIFGRRTRTDDPDVEALFRTINHLRQPPGKWLVNNWTQLENLPNWMQWWRPYGEAMYEDTIGTYRNLYKSFEEEQEKGIQKDCFATKFFPVADELGFSKDQQMFVIGTLVEAATDTTRNSNHVLIAHAAHDPSWAKAVRDQLDEVCGHNAERLPDYDDWDKLPLIHATIKESLRIFPNVPRTGVPHALSKDDEYEGYRFQAGTVFISNHFHIATNPEEHFEPRRFNPQRYMNEHVKDMFEGQLGFGSGRRICVGWNVGWKNMFIVFSRLLYCFDFGEDPEAPIDVVSIPIHETHKPPFKVTIKPRSKAHEDLIMRSCKYAADTGQVQVRSHVNEANFIGRETEAQ